MTIYGYARVSSKSQEDNSSLETQKKELFKNGVPETGLIIEIGSAADEIQNRSKFHQLINETLQEGDTLMVTKIDRCSRNTLEFLKLQDSLFKRNISFISLDLPFSDDAAINRLMGAMLSSIAEFENNRRKQRQAEGILAAKKAGKYKGRKTVITPQLIQQIKVYKDEKGLGVTEISQLVGVSSPTIYKVLKNHLNYVSPRLVKKK